jgi:hypothetical protein
MPLERLWEAGDRADRPANKIHRDVEPLCTSRSFEVAEPARSRG